jgi:hypothetical protein
MTSLLFMSLPCADVSMRRHAHPSWFSCGVSDNCPTVS